MGEKLQWDISRIARQCAFLHKHVDDRPDGKEMLDRFLDRLYDAITVYDGDEEPDLTFCCGCREQIDGDAWVVFGSKYHEKCCSSASTPVMGRDQVESPHHCRSCNSGAVTGD